MRRGLLRPRGRQGPKVQIPHWLKNCRDFGKHMDKGEWLESQGRICPAFKEEPFGGLPLVLVALLNRAAPLLRQIPIHFSAAMLRKTLSTKSIGPFKEHDSRQNR